MAERTRGVVLTLGLLAAVVALWVVPMLLGSSLDEPFAGTDAQATALVEETGYQPWFTPIFQPSGEVEAGLFALQAALGAALLAYILGRWHCRRLRRARGATAGSDFEATEN